jgi:hypothetical protein
MVAHDEMLISPRDLASRYLLDLQPPELVFHYTTIEGAYGILTSDAIWMTKARYLSDTSELEIAIVTFREMLNELALQARPPDEKELLQAVHDGLDSFAASNICVTSFCEHGDLLSQWRWYGEGGRGVSVGVASAVLRGLASGEINLWKCVYDVRAHRELLNALVDRLLDAYRTERQRGGGKVENEPKRILLERFFASFLQIAPIIKNPHFAEEREWRLVSRPIDPDDKAYGVCLTGDRIIERYELRFPRDEDGVCRAIGRIVIGPSKDPELIGEAIGVLCRRQRIHCPAVAYSMIPFRHW